MSSVLHPLGDCLDSDSPSYFLTLELLRFCPDLSPDEKQIVQSVFMAVLSAEKEGHTHLLLQGDSPANDAPSLAFRGYTPHPGDTSSSGTLRQSLKLVLKPEVSEEEIEAIARSAFFLLEDPRLSCLIGKPGEQKPLILDGRILASHRSHLQENHLNQLLLQRLESRPHSPDRKSQDVFSSVPSELSEEQRAAVKLAGKLLLTVISGGPGTGKTSIVSALISHLCSLGLRPSEIGLAAPTGKAANRLEQAILDSWPRIQAIDLSLVGHPAPAGMTLHRLIGAGRKAGRFSYHSGNPLPMKAVIIDEASMIDLSLMHNLLQAISTTCRLVLLGDADQLPAVENGAVFRDLVAPPGFQGIPPWCCRLTHSFRMRADDPHGSGILRLAEFIRNGCEFPDSETIRDQNLVVPALCRTRCQDLVCKGPELLELPPGVRQADNFIQWWFETIWKWPDELLDRLRNSFSWDSENPVSADIRDLEKLFSHFLSSRLLAATRQLGTGTEAMNQLAGKLYRRQLGRASHEEFIPGEPVLMTRNDYLNEVFNGDQGLILWATTPTSPKSSLHAVFRRSNGFQAIPFEAIRHDLEPAYALTVHKSQGSEFDQVFFLLPEADHPLLTREIIYTAVTRARKGVVLIGPRETVNLGLRRSISRLSRLTFPLSSDSG